jgi:hypothetical protein
MEETHVDINPRKYLDCDEAFATVTKQILERQDAEVIRMLFDAARDAKRQLNIQTPLRQYLLIDCIGTKVVEL